MAVWVSTRPEIHTDFLDSDKKECHITLAYLGEVDFDEVFNCLKKTHEVWPPEPFTREIRGFGTWVVPEAGYVLYASVFDVRNLLLRWHEDICKDLRAACGIRANDDFPFIPHISLGWSFEPFTDMPELSEPVTFTVNNLYVSENEYHQEVWSV